MTTRQPRLARTTRAFLRFATGSVAIALLLAPTALAAEGNNGTLKVHEQGTPSGTESNDPKVCIFNFEGFGFDVGQDGYIQIDGQGQTTGSFGPYAFGPTVANEEHLSYAETGYFNDEDGPEITNGLYVATLYGKDTGGNINLDDEKAKSKVFTVECAAEEPEPVEGDVKVIKVVDADGSLATAGDQTPAADWTFDFAITGGEIVDEVTTTGADGLAGFTFEADAETAGLTVTEVLPEGWTLLAAGCRTLVEGVSGDPVGTWTGLGVSFDAAADGDYECVFVNAEEAGEEPIQEPSQNVPSPSTPVNNVTESESPDIPLPATDSLGSGGASEAGSVGVVLVGLIALTMTAVVTTKVRGSRRA